MVLLCKTHLLCSKWPRFGHQVARQMQQTAVYFLASLHRYLWSTLFFLYISVFALHYLPPMFELLQLGFRVQHRDDSLQPRGTCTRFLSKDKQITIKSIFFVRTCLSKVHTYKRCIGFRLTK